MAQKIDVKFCHGLTWMYVREVETPQGMVQLWRCNSCGAVTRNIGVLSTSMKYPHYKPGHEPKQVESQL